MVGCGYETKCYKLFETSTFNTFVERSVKFEEEPIPDLELAPRECSSPQPFEDVSDDTCSVFLIFMIKMLINMKFLNMTHHIGPIGLKILYK